SPCVDAGTALFILDGDTILNIPDVDFNGNAPDMGAFESEYVTSLDQSGMKPTEFVLLQSYPNPFNPTTTIRFGLPEMSDVTLVIYDVKGRVAWSFSEIAHPAGWVNQEWNGFNSNGDQVSTGVYFCRLEAGNFSQTIKMVYLR
ncbi:T9SS type A sorting domain-containing protein, partial [bacterium]|nr:T9SS type A sorting domain-containing protein [bacterium]